MKNGSREYLAASSERIGPAKPSLDVLFRLIGPKPYGEILASNGILFGEYHGHSIPRSIIRLAAPTDYVYTATSH